MPTRVAVDETAIRVDGEVSWLYTAIDTTSKVLLEGELFSRYRIDSPSALLHRSELVGYRVSTLAHPRFS
ncbi:hypothetical protein [Natronorarus salvus]|uniref:hypothetical protein n=1 Tax=Natronorarus salvus TaxID=3117733 RepID=UPI00390811F9